MTRTKTVERIVCVTTALMLATAILLWGVAEPARENGGPLIGYEQLLFDTGRVHTVDITMEDWEGFIANAMAEEYAPCSIAIDGERYDHVGIRAKGNTSLSSVAAMGSTRYSFKVEFDHYVKGMTYYGLDKLSLNNLIQDATMMKDYIAYTLMNRMQVPSSLCSYVQISVNGEPWGLYLAVEGVEEAFMDRNGMSKGELYKPDSMSFGGGRGKGQDFSFDRFTNQSAAEGKNPVPDAFPGTQEDGQTEGNDASSGESSGASSGMPAMPPEGDFAPSGGDSAQSVPPLSDQVGAPDGEAARTQPGTAEIPEAGGFQFGMGNDDVKLIYTDDNPESYGNIFENAKTGVTARDKARLVEALRKLNAGEDLEATVDRDEVIRYLAVHHFLCNDDSYTGMMVHNYYLYEEKGKLSILPWDYNLAFGGFAAATNATSTVNSPIDTPVSGGTVDSRPLIAWIFEDESATEDYHAAYDRFIAENIESGWLEDEIERVKTLITPYLEEDASAFYGMEAFEKAVNTLQAFCRKRGESIRGQLEGTIPSTSQAQRENRAALVDASELSTADMGSMNTGKGAPGENRAQPDGGETTPPAGKAEGMGPGSDGSSGESAGSSRESAQPSERAQDEEATPPEAGKEKTGRSNDVPLNALQNGRAEKWISLGIWSAVLLFALRLARHAGSHND